MVRNFIHTNVIHLLANIAGLVILYKIESEKGTGSFTCIFFAILVLSSIIEYLMYTFVPSVNCSIGLSGIIFGFAMFELVCSKKCSLGALAGLVAVITLPSIQDTNVSVSGHIIGALSGFLTALVYNFSSLQT